MAARASPSTSHAIADRLNKGCFCVTLDRAALCKALIREAGDPEFCVNAIETRPHLFSNVPVFLPSEVIGEMAGIVAAIEQVARMPAYREAAFAWAPEIAREDRGPLGAFMGYDFHLGGEGPRLIEINTNAGGAFLNALLARAQLACCGEVAAGLEMLEADDFAANVVAMFKEEWRRRRGDRTMPRVAIVDDRPQEQYLFPEFVLAREMLLKAGIEAVIADAADLVLADGRLTAGGLEIGMIYNRLTDFAFAQPEHAALRAAYRDDAVVVTPGPHNHALFADKRNLTLLSDPALLKAWGVPAALRDRLATIPRTVPVTPENADALWEARRTLFFKPTGGHGGKAVYRGDKVTRGVWAEIAKGGYVAQAFAAPGERSVLLDGAPVARKMDVRLYTYGGRILLAAARLYQGQTTNFRTPGGGFAPVFGV
ncbi:MAG TPA: hypothetical protein GX405_02750 [Rhizobiales bacterium]|nr:hypothetical protein [Hyphomicrobiales bacterium]